jgi:hypothetical protein
MSTTKQNNQNDTEGLVQAKSKKTWSIDRKQQQKPIRNFKKIVKENIPDVVADMLVVEFLTLVGNRDWNDPLNVSKTIADMMSIDLSLEKNQSPLPVEIDRTVFVPANKGSDIPYWICQSIIRVDEKFGNRFIIHNGSKYNKIDIVFDNEYFKNRMNEVARAAHCTWNARWGNSNKEENRLYQKTRTGSQSDESWLNRCVRHLITDEDTDGINIKNLIMIEFKRSLGLKEVQTDKIVVTKIKKKNENGDENGDEVADDVIEDVIEDKQPN